MAMKVMHTGEFEIISVDNSTISTMVPGNILPRSKNITDANGTTREELEVAPKMWDGRRTLSTRRRKKNKKHK